MSEKKTILLKFNQKEKKVQAFETFQELVSFFIEYFSIDENNKKNLSLSYYEEDGDQISVQSNKDYIIFIEDEEFKDHIIEGQIIDINNEENSMEDQDPMEILGVIFNKKIKEQYMDMGIKNNGLLENSLYISDNLYNRMPYNLLEKQLIDEKNKNKNLNEKVKQLEKELENSKNMVKELKGKEIEKLKQNNNSLNNIKPGEEIYSINFDSFDKKIRNCSITCKNTDIFVKIEEQLCEDYPEYKNKETYFLVNGQKIKRFKSLDENKIKKNDILMLFICD